MAVEKGFLKCECGQRASVFEFGGQKSGSFYTKCCSCGTNQRGGLAGQQFVIDNMIATAAEYDAKYSDKTSNDVVLDDSDIVTKTDYNAVFDVDDDDNKTLKTVATVVFGVLLGAVGVRFLR